MAVERVGEPGDRESVNIHLSNGQVTVSMHTPLSKYTRTHNLGSMSLRDGGQYGL